MLHPFFTRPRKVLALVLTVLLLVSLTGCFKDKEPDSTGGNENPIPSQSQTQTDPPETDPPETKAPETEPPETQAPETDPPETQPPATNPASTSVFGTVTPEKLNIRKEPSTAAAKAGYYVKGDRIEITETKSGWGRTKHGWVLLEYVQMESENLPESGTNDQPDNAGPDDVITSDGNTKALGHGVVTIGSLNVRTGPGTKYEAIGKVSLCKRFAYYQKSGSWVRIEKGWISLSYFYVEGTTGEGAGTGTIFGADVNIRSGPGTDFDRVGTYKENTKITVLAQVDNWIYTEKGWVNGNYVAMTVHPTGKGTVTADTLNIRKSAKVDSEKVGEYTKNTVIEILEVKGDWGRTDKGWVSLQYVKMDESATVKTQKGTVTASSLYIRKEPKKDGEILGSYNKDDKVEILETKDGWGRTDKGWISLDYVKLDNAKAKTVTEAGQSGTVTASGLYIRKEPTTNAESLGWYREGDKVTVLETKDGWGRTDLGWIKLEYVKLS